MITKNQAEEKKDVQASSASTGTWARWEKQELGEIVIVSSSTGCDMFESKMKHRWKQRRAACYFQWLLWLLTWQLVRYAVTYIFIFRSWPAMQWDGVDSNITALRITHVSAVSQASPCFQVLRDPNALLSLPQVHTNLTAERGFHQHLFPSETASSHLLPTRQLPQNELLINC